MHIEVAFRENLEERLPIEVNVGEVFEFLIIDVRVSKS